MELTLGCVKGNLDDAASVAKAIEGANVVFGVTDCKFKSHPQDIRCKNILTCYHVVWQTLSKDKEIAQGKAIVDAAKAAKVDRFIFSSLPNVSKGTIPLPFALPPTILTRDIETGGKITEIQHFDSKALVEAYAREQNVPGTYFLPAVFMPGFLSSFRLSEDKSSYTFTTGWDPSTTQIPFIDVVADTGLYIAAILLNLPSTLNKRIAAAGDVLSPNKLAEAVASKSGKEAKANQVSWETFKGFLPPAIAEELTANMELIVEPGYYVGEPADAVQKGHELIAKSGLRKPHTWKDFVEQNLKV
jgi:hypothetical protein